MDKNCYDYSVKLIYSRYDYRNMSSVYKCPKRGESYFDLFCKNSFKCKCGLNVYIPKEKH